MNCYKYLLHNILILYYQILVTLLNSFKVEVKCEGCLHLIQELELHNVFYVPTLKYNLLLISQLCAQFDCDKTFCKSACTLQTVFLK